MKLNARQEQFCKEYLVDLNAKQAAVRAGYSRKTAGEIACENLRKPHIAARVAELQAERAVRVEITQDYVLANIREIGERCMQHVPALDRKGNPTGEFRFDSLGALRAFELLGKHLGMFGDKPQGDTVPPLQALEHWRALLGLGNDSPRH